MPAGSAIPNGGAGRRSLAQDPPPGGCGACCARDKKRIAAVRGLGVPWPRPRASVGGGLIPDP